MKKIKKIGLILLVLAVEVVLISVTRDFFDLLFIHTDILSSYPPIVSFLAGFVFFGSIFLDIVYGGLLYYTIFFWKDN